MIEQKTDAKKKLDANTRASLKVSIYAAAKLSRGCRVQCANELAKLDESLNLRISWITPGVPGGTR
jgi:hypothetical protein